MLSAKIPGFGALSLEHLVLDFNGTLALDGRLLPNVRGRIGALARALEVHVVTADTFGSARRALRGLPCKVVVLDQNAQDRAKGTYVRRLGAACTVSVGNGRNDRAMLRAARLGIAVLGPEGASAEALRAAHVVAPSIVAALDLLLHPLRLTATLRA